MSFNIDSSANQIMRGSTNNNGTVGTVVAGSCGQGQIGSAICNTPVVANTWTDYTGSFTWNGTAGLHDFGFEAISTFGGDTGTGNFLDDIQIQLAPYVELSPGAASASESVANSAIPKLVVTGNLTAPLSITLQLAGTGTATLGTDFTTPSGSNTWTVTIPAGNYDGGTGSQFATGINVINDSLPEQNETIVVNLVSNPASYTIAGTQSCGAPPVTQFTYTIIDNDPPAVQIKKNSVGAVGTFSFGLTGATPVSDTITTITAGTDATSTVVHAATIGGAVTLTETPVAGFTTAISCVDVNSSLTGTTGSITSTSNAVTIPGANIKALTQYVCTFTNTKQPALSLQKALGGIGRLAVSDQFSLSGTGAGAPAASTTTGAGTAVTSAPYAFAGTAGTAYSLNETMAAGSASGLALYNQTVACTNTGSTAVTGFTTLPINVTPAAGDAITCTVTNTPKPAGLQLAKAWGASSPAGDTANIGATTGGTSNTASFSTAGGTPANSGTPVTVSVGNTIVLPAETFTPAARAANYTSAVACTAGGGPTANALSGSNGKLSNSLLIGAGDIGKTIICTYTNNLVIANLSIVKTANPTNVQTGGTVTFTLTLNNAGPAAANGAILRDKPGPGLSCTATPTCTASGGAVCPTISLTAPALTSNAGVAIPVLPAGGQAVVTLVCTATASGQ